MAEPKEPLTERELEIVRLVGTGVGNKEIAARLFLSPNTVKVHLRNIFTKLEAASRTEVTMIAIRNGWITVFEPPAGDSIPRTNGDRIGATPAIPAAQDGHETAQASSPQQAVRQANQDIDNDKQYVPTLSAAGITASIVPVAPNPEPLPLVATWKRLLLAGAAIAILLLIALFIPSTLTVSSSGYDPLRIGPSQVRTGLLTRGEASRWYMRAPLPAARARSAAVAVGNFIYVIGGEVNQTVSGDLLRFEPISNTWTLMSSPKPTPVANTGAAVVGSHVYVIGGADSNGNTTSAVEAYDTTNNTWQVLKQLPIPLAGHAVASLGGTIYVFGGIDHAGATNTSLAYNTETNAWSTQAPIPTARSLAAAESLGDRIYVVGGYADGHELATCEYFIPAMQTWDTCAPLTVPRSGLGLARVGSSLFAIGGGVTGFIGFNERYDPTTNRWTAVETPLTGDWQSIAVASLPTEFYVFGGYNNGERLAFSYVYEVFTNRVYVPAFLSSDSGGHTP